VSGAPGGPGRPVDPPAATEHPVPAERLRPGDRVVSTPGGESYEVHLAEVAQGRVQVSDTRGHAHIYRFGEDVMIDGYGPESARAGPLREG
jgi:hypothetical protein